MNIFLPLGLTVVVLTTAMADIYRTVDENGNVIYTDVKPLNGSQDKVELPDITPMDSSTVHKFSKPVTTYYHPQNTVEYTGFRIVSPKNNATIRNEGDFSVNLMVMPKLQNGHKIKLSLDGKHVSTQKSFSFSLQNISRGSHEITAELIDRSGKTIRSNSITVHVHRAVVSPN